MLAGQPLYTENRPAAGVCFTVQGNKCCWLVLLEDCRLLCFFANEEVKKIDLNRLKNSGDVDKIINNERLYRSGHVEVVCCLHRVNS